MATVEPKAKRSPWSPECSVSVDDIRQFLLDLGSSFSSLDCRVLEIVNSSSTWIEIYCSKSVLLTCNGTPVNLNRLVVNPAGTFTFECLFGGRTEEGECADDLDTLTPYLESMLPSSDMKFCPGIADYGKQFESVRFHTKNLRKWTFPFVRFDSEHCSVWHKAGRTLPLEEKNSPIVPCKACKALQHDLERLVKRATERNQDDKAARVSASSTVPLKYLSPHSHSVRARNKSEVQRITKRQLARLEQFDFELCEEQSSELSAVCQDISSSFAPDLEGIFEDAGDEADILRAAWHSDVVAQEQFNKDQKQNASGSKGNRWSMITYRLALAVFTRSPAAYEALKSFGILQLPSVRSLKHFTGAHLDNPGWCEDNMVFQLQKYSNFKKVAEAEQRLVPTGDGVMVFDEVKVVSKVLWNSKSQQIYGLSMTSDDLSSLHDVYTDLKDEKTDRTEYILQTLWRDMSGSFDIIGPYYTAAKTLDAKFTLACVMDTLRLFHAYDFKVSALVCDGASTNMAMIKSMMGKSGSFGMQEEEGPNRHDIRASVEHPVWANHRLFFIICPSHQLKNMVNALSSSSRGGAKAFVTQEGVPFGWQTIIDMYQRECAKMRAGEPRDVPHLRKNFVYRDSWTKLNVLPAKIMQQEKVLTELAVHCLSHPADVANVQASRQYLLACSKLFEEGTLSHVPVRSPTCTPLQSIKSGYAFFESWLNGLLLDPAFTASSPKQTSFLSWQTWDLLRIMCFGFVEFCEDYVTRHPGYYIVPVRVSGSAVETLFSQLKHSAGGRLSAVNYSTARASLALQRNLHPVHASGKDYRDAALDYESVPLRRKK
ncbi:uncharacterized protein LOC135806751 [Sycon ciliatum]|uniref:uncharacterized protein LOC135806749 n=1 Tax=Sycon ciliatum TaxID=27933 RepID=UPI0031F6CC12